MVPFCYNQPLFLALLPFYQFFLLYYQPPKKTSTKKTYRQIFFYLMKLSPFFPNIPFIHSLCHIHFAHLYVLHELSLHCMRFTSFILCGHTQLSQIVFLSLHTTGILYVKCFFFSFSFYKAIFIFYPRCPLREIVLLSVVIIRVVAERLW